MDEQGFFPVVRRRLGTCQSGSRSGGTGAQVTRALAEGIDLTLSIPIGGQSPIQIHLELFQLR